MPRSEKQPESFGRLYELPEYLLLTMQKKMVADQSQSEARNSFLVHLEISFPSILRSFYCYFLLDVQMFC